MLNRHQVLIFEKNGERCNPNLNDVFNDGGVVELFNHAFLQTDSVENNGDAIIVACEPYDRALSNEDRQSLFKLIREKESLLCSMYGGLYVEIENYL